MTGSRLVAFLLAACALAASALLAIPVESFDALGSRSTPAATTSVPDERPVPPARSTTADSTDHTVPRLWLR